jgi:nitrate reductase NapD
MPDNSPSATELPPVTHISSLLLRADPQHMEHVLSEIGSIAAADVALTDDVGRIIVTLETDDESEIVNHLNSLSLVDGVVSAALVYHQAEALN